MAEEMLAIQQNQYPIMMGDGSKRWLTLNDCITLCGSPHVTESEFALFGMMCSENGLNPFKKEAYLVKFGTNKATMIVAKAAYMKRAFEHPDFDGFSAGVTIIGQDGGIYRRKGSLVLQNETLVGGWCSAWMKSKSHEFFEEVSLQEYQQRKDGMPTGNWLKMPGTMIRKVAIVHVLREMFPETLGGLYVAEEMHVEEPTYEDPEDAPAEELTAKQLEFMATAPDRKG